MTNNQLTKISSNTQKIYTTFKVTFPYALKMTEIIPSTQSSQNSVKDSMNELDELMASLSNSFLPLASTQNKSAAQKQPPSTTNNETQEQQHQPPNISCVTASTAKQD